MRCPWLLHSTDECARSIYLLLGSIYVFLSFVLPYDIYICVWHILFTKIHVKYHTLHSADELSVTSLPSGPFTLKQRVTCVRSRVFQPALKELCRSSFIYCFCPSVFSPVGFDVQRQGRFAKQIVEIIIAQYGTSLARIREIQQSVNNYIGLISP